MTTYPAKKAAVIGDGGWGTALALILHANGFDVSVWGPFEAYTDQIRTSRENHKFLPGIKLPDDIHWTARPEETTADCDLAVLASPSKFYPEVLSKFSGCMPDQADIVSVTKGLHPEQLVTMTALAEQILNRDDVAGLSGPSHAEEVARGIPTAVVIASRNIDRSKRLQAAFSNQRFRAYTSDDVLGVELGGALKNVIAVAVGVSDGLGFGDNTRAALITRGLAEMSRLGCALGAHPSTFTGLSGMGDLIVTCTSRHSRNRSVGERLGHGDSIEQIMSSMEQVAEGVWTSASVVKLAAKHHVDVPIAAEVNAILYEGKNPAQAVEDLLSRDLRPERDAV